MQGQVAQFFSQRKDPQGSWGLGMVELQGSLAETSKSRRLGQRLKATTGKCLKAITCHLLRRRVVMHVSIHS